MADLRLTITERMTKKFRWLAPLLNKTFTLKRMMAKYDGCCILSGKAFPASTEDNPVEIGYFKVNENGAVYTLVVLACEAQSQMKSDELQKPTKIGENPYRIPSNKISPYQKQASDIFNNENCNLIEESRAGGGKTTMLKHHASFRKEGDRMIYLAFNKKNAKEGAKKLPREVPSLTTHSFMGGVIRDNNVKIGYQADKTKTMQIINEIYPPLNNKKRKKIRRATTKLVALAKAFACKPEDTTNIQAVMDKYSFDLPEKEDYEATVELTAQVLKLSLPSSKYGLLYDYNDMLWWPIVMDMDFPRYTCVLADEAQDFNVCQIEMMRNLGESGARLVIVGDPFQSCYSFRGADMEAFSKLCKMLGEFPRGVKKVLLPINYRSGKKIIQYVKDRTHVKDIEAAPDAIEGEVRTDLTYAQILELLVKEFKQGD